MGKTNPKPPSLPTLPEGYEYIKELSSGNYGIVWLVRNENVNRYEAIKVLFRTGAIEYQRFCQEMETIATLNHPNIVTVYYAKPDEYYFIMEYLEQSLDAYLKRRDFSSFEGVRFLKQVAKGLHFAHNKGIVHRDLKPANILFAAERIPKITDFGLVKHTDINALEKKNLTGSISIGTPRYMAPEQWENKPQIDHRSDIWAMGIMLYEILAKQYPFANLSGIQLANAVITNPIPAPHKVRPLSEWETLAVPICMKALERSPEDRYPSARYMEQELQRILNIEETNEVPLEILMPHTEENMDPRPFGGTAVRTMEEEPTPTKKDFKLGLIVVGVLLVLSTLISLVIHYNQARNQQFKENKTSLEQIQLQLKNAQGQLTKERRKQQKQQKQMQQREQTFSKEKLQQQALQKQLTTKQQELNALKQKITKLEKKQENFRLERNLTKQENLKLQQQITIHQKEITLLEKQMEKISIQRHHKEKQIKKLKDKFTQRQKTLKQELERLIQFENKLYKITLITKNGKGSKIFGALQQKGFHMRRPIDIERYKNRCTYFSRQNPPPPELEKKIDYVIQIVNKYVKIKLHKRKLSNNNEKEIKIELMND